LACTAYIGHFRIYRFVFKHLISGTFGKNRSGEKMQMISAKEMSGS
jgi:hypothetical protein